MSLPIPSLLRYALATGLLALTASAEAVTIGASADNTLYSSSAFVSNGAGEYVFAGVSLHTSGIRRGLLLFDVANAIPAGSTITSVQLTLDMSNTIAGPVEVGLHRASTTWGEGLSDAPGGEGGGASASLGDATWSFRFYASTPWAVSGGEFAPSASAVALVDGIGTYTWASTALLAADVQAWLDAPSANYGWFLVSGDEMTQPSAKRFGSRQNLDPAQRPRLTIGFVAPVCGSVSTYCVGAPNSVGPGATLVGTGSTSVAMNTFSLTTAQLPPNAAHLFFYGSSTAETVFGNGFRCVGGSVTRLSPPGLASSAGDASRTLDFTLPPVLGTIAAGDVRYFQCWYRNPAAGGAGFNLSNGVSVGFCP